MVFKLALRNLLRNKRRSVLTMMIIVAGFVVMSFSYGLSEGGYDKIIELFTENKTGHIQILQNQYLDDPTLYKTIKNIDQIEDTIASKLKNSIRIKTKIEGGALASYKDKTIGTQILGVKIRTLTKDPQKKFNGIGRLYRPQANNEIVVGQKIAKKLNISIGKELILLSQASDGSMSNDLFKVVGIFNKSSFFDHSIHMSLASAQEFFSLWNQAHRLIIFIKSFKYADSIKSTTERLISHSKDINTYTWKEVESDFNKGMEQDKAGNQVLFFIIGIVIALGVLNTILMTLLERKKEFSIIKAIGTRPNQILQLILMENVLLITFSIVFASIISFGLNYWFMIDGIKLDTPIDFEGIVIDELISTVRLSIFYVPSLVVLISAFTVILWPAIRISRMNPSEGMRSI